MQKCKVCGRRFQLLKKNRYEVKKAPVGFNCLTEGTVYYNAFDCPFCGCQNIVGTIEKSNIKEEPQETWNGYHGQVTAPKGTFEKIYNDTEEETQEEGGEE